ncbi:ferredoxin reductase [Pigmentiphaga litoralis]|uniref:NAD(P)/FAD-dependent oxidoreductase n=1 Tax=Pigmentiphaga litoralis TaxID=516702 RepID=UPI0016783587|nr:FAD-dependent oxidoreductase [Pigmentiphaga litoralis]GGX03525.1 ferredoxin reductase [Pigmentiphaga litoralis]
MNPLPVIVIGAGHAGVECAFALRQAGVPQDILLIGDEPHLPYERPPLSKAMLSDALDIERVQLKPMAAFDKARITLRRGERVARLDTASRTVHLAGGEALHYSDCILATGGRARLLPGMDAMQVHAIRTLDDALRLKPELVPGQRLVVIGAGYLGLEIASTAAKLGLHVTVLENGRLMGGKVSPYTEARFAALHRDAGVALFTGVAVARCEGGPGDWRITLADGAEHEADLLLVSIGAVPNTELAEAAGIRCHDGIEVDALCQTSASGLFAIGDCANAHSHHGQRRCRIESVQNALFQARTVAAQLAGKPVAAVRPPTFWSEQCGKRLQMAGLVLLDAPIDDHVTHTDRGWVVERFQQGALRAVEAVDSPVDFVQKTRMIAAPISMETPACTTLSTEPQHA